MFFQLLNARHLLNLIPIGVAQILVRFGDCDLVLQFILAYLHELIEEFDFGVALHAETKPDDEGAAGGGVYHEG
jgi:hypothetical protein